MKEEKDFTYVVEAKGVKRKYYPRTCAECGTIFYVRLTSAAQSCSRKCAGKLKSRNTVTSKIVFICAYCGKEIEKWPSVALKAIKTGKHYCDRSCQTKDQIKHYRKVGRLSKEERCERCGYDSYPVLEIHHKDSNHKNNEPDNLELLCPNCHLVSHYKNRTGKFRKQNREKNY